MGIDIIQQKNIFSLISGILHLGNVLFLPDDCDGQVGGVQPSKEEELSLAAFLLGLETDRLLACLIRQNMHVSGLTIVKTQNQTQAVILPSYCIHITNT